MKRMPKSIRKYIRKEKARIRQEFLNAQEREEKLKELFEAFLPLTELTKGSKVDKVPNKIK